MHSSDVVWYMDVYMNPVLEFDSTMYMYDQENTYFDHWVHPKMHSFAQVKLE